MADEASSKGSVGFGVSEIVNLVSAGVGGLVDFIATAIPTKLDKMRNKRIKELQAQFEAGTLGLTPSQLQEIQTLGAGGIQATQKEFFQRQADIMRGTSGGAFQAALAGQAQADALRKQESELQRQIFAAERDAEKAQLGELSGLKEEQRERRKEVADAAINFLTLGLASGAKAIDISEQQKQLLGGSTKPLGGETPDQIQMPQVAGISEEEIAALNLSDEQVKALKAKGLL